MPHHLPAQSWAGSLGRLQALLVAVVVVGCGAGDGAAPSDTGVDVQSDAAGDGTDRETEVQQTCHDLRRLSDDSCCPCGSFAGSDGSCTAVGPASCAHLCDLLFTDPEVCTPEWQDSNALCAAGTWSDLLADGACRPAGIPPGCDPSDSACHAAGWRWTEEDAPGVGRLCRADEWDDPGCCPPGLWADPWADGACRAAGAPGGCDGPDALDCHDVDWRWRVDEGTVAVVCDYADESCCAPGEWRPDPAGQCVPAGLSESWCPGGFMPAGAGPGCVPDPASCLGAVPPAGAIVVTTSAELSAALIDAPSGAVLWIAPATTAPLVGSWVVDRPMTLQGACAADVRLEAGTEADAVVTIQGPAASDIVVRDLTIGGPARGVVVGAGGAVLVERAYFDAPLRVGVRVSKDGVAADVRDVVVNEPVEDSAGKSHGVAVWDGVATVTGLRVQGALSAGVFVGLHGTAVGAHVLTTGPSTAGSFAMGVQCEGGQFTLDDLTVRDAHAVGVYLDDGCQAALAGLLVEDTRVTLQSGIGDAMEVQHGSSAVLRGAHLARSQRIGVFLQDDALLDAAGLLIDGAGPNGPLPGSPEGHGLFAQDGTVVRLRAARIEAYEDRGFVVSSGTDLDAAGLVVGERRPLLSKDAHGADITAARVTITGGRFAGTLSPRLLIGETAPADVVLRGVLLARGQTDLGEAANGDGIKTQLQGGVTVLGAHIADASAGGLTGLDSGARVRAVGVLVERTRPGQDGKLGEAVFVQGGATAEVFGLLALDNAEAGLAAIDGSTLVVEGARVTGIAGHEPPFYGSGNGLAVLSGSTASVSASHFEDGASAGVFVGDDGSNVQLRGVRVSSTRPVVGLDIDGMGLDVRRSAEASVHGCAIEENHGAGVRVLGIDSEAEIVGTSISDTRPEPDGELFGMGVQVAFEGAVTIRSSLLTDNTTGGLSMYVGQGSMEDSVVRGVTPGRFLPPGEPAPITLGDGILVHDAFAGVVLRRNLVTGSPRAGLLINRAAVTTEAHLLTGNLYGIVTQEAELEEAGMLAFENELQDRAGDLGLSVGPPPAAADVSDPGGGQ